MNHNRIVMTLLAGTLATLLTGCAGEPQSMDVTSSVRSSLDQAGLKDVKVAQDRTKGVVTLSGNVAMEEEKASAGNIAKNLAGTQVVANEIAVVPPAMATDAKAMNSSMDEGIETNLHTALLKAKMGDVVKHSVKNKVVTLTGEVSTQAKRAEAEKLAAAVMNVDQVVNELQVKGQKATSTP